jgi:hypothetical protein
MKKLINFLLMLIGNYDSLSDEDKRTMQVYP